MGLLEELLRGGLAQSGLGQAMGRQQNDTGRAGSGMASAVMALLPIVLGMLANRQGGPAAPPAAGGGIADILEQFQRAGYGDQARSWVSTGANLPISPDAISDVFGRETLSQIASQAGLSEREASAGLTEVLPDVVDRLTPQGDVPDLDTLAASVGDLQRRLGL
jgi:uncharacterized protein YidB (DUF937 family)